MVHFGNHCTFLGVWPHWPSLSSPVRSLEVATGILSLSLVEAGARVVILDTVFISERLRGEFFFFVGGGVVGSGGGFVSWGGFMVSWGRLISRFRSWYISRSRFVCRLWGRMVGCWMVRPG